jgi:hypothetical protein
MANITCNFTLTSNDLSTTAPLSVSTTNTLLKAGLQIGLDQVRMGRNEVATGTSFDLFDASAASIDKSNWIYIANLETDPTLYVTIVIDAETIGRLYAGDWMFMPWNADDATHDIEITASSGTQTIEWIKFHEGETLLTQAD